MEDLFEREQSVLDDAVSRIEKGTACSLELYAALANEYRRLLKQLRRITKISDKTTVDLNTSKLDLLDKVHFDEMTGIYNRRFFDEKLCGLLYGLACNSGELSVLMIDVDFFKNYNDTYGHAKGDDCLRLVAQTICACMTGEDQFVARYGGEEFVVVLPNTDENGAQRMSLWILENIRACGIPHENNDVATVVTVSLGSTTGVVNSSHTIQDYIRIADRALYQSKQNGRNQSTFIQLEATR